MKTVQMTLDADLVRTVDRVAKQMGSTRSGFTRLALRWALERLRTREREQRQAEGYRRNPVKSDEFAAWENEQAWPD